MGRGGERLQHAEGPGDRLDEEGIALLRPVRGGWFGKCRPWHRERLTGKDARVHAYFDMIVSTKDTVTPGRAGFMAESAVPTHF